MRNWRWLIILLTGVSALADATPCQLALVGSPAELRLRAQRKHLPVFTRADGRPVLLMAPQTRDIWMDVLQNSVGLDEDGRLRVGLLEDGLSTRQPRVEVVFHITSTQRATLEFDRRVRLAGLTNGAAAPAAEQARELEAELRGLGLSNPRQFTEQPQTQMFLAVAHISLFAVPEANLRPQLVSEPVDLSFLPNLPPAVRAQSPTIQAKVACRLVAYAARRAAAQVFYELGWPEKATRAADVWASPRVQALIVYAPLTEAPRFADGSFSSPGLAYLSNH